MAYLKYCMTAVLLLPAFAFALSKGDTLPVTDFNNLGRMALDKKGEYKFIDWSTSNLKGKKWVVQYISPRPGIGPQNTHLNDALAKYEKPHEFCHTVNIVNLDEALWGTKSIAKSRMAGGLKINDKCIIVADDESKGLTQWQLKPKSNSTFVINGAGKVIFFHNGQLSKQHIKAIETLIFTHPPLQENAPTTE